MATETTSNRTPGTGVPPQKCFMPQFHSHCAHAFVTYVARDQTLQIQGCVPWCQQLRWGQGPFHSPTTSPCKSLLLLWYNTKNSFLQVSSVSSLSPAAMTENLPPSCPKLNRRKKSEQQRSLWSFTRTPFQEMLLHSIGPSKSTSFAWVRKNSVLMLLIPHLSLLLAFQDDFSVLSPAKQLLWSELPAGILPFPCQNWQLCALSQKVQFFLGMYKKFHLKVLKPI